MSGKNPEILPPETEESTLDALHEPGANEAHAKGPAADFLADGSQILDPESAPVPIPLDALSADDDSASLPTGPGQVSSLSYYMSQLADHAPISREEEHALAVRWTEEGDVAAARKLVVSNLRLVVKIAMEYRRAWTNSLDLIQEGNVGLMEAVQRYDPYQGVKLSSYAVYWIRAYILKYILDNMRSVRLGTTRASRKLFFQLNKERARLEREGFEVEPKLIAERLDVTEDDVIEMESRLSRPDTYLDAPARREDGHGATVGDSFATSGASAESQVGDAELRATIQQRIEEFAEGLNERDQRILRERILADEPRTLAEMGEEFGVSRERIRQLEARMIKNLRAYVQENMVDFDYYTPTED
ncbi:MAG: RNA polymerase factor sigma-32 [Myxococcota bacterium]|nr:RNA polymerase factor sigma-32 [Myxococcota bacterium]